MTRFKTITILFSVLVFSLFLYACNEDTGTLRVDYSSAPPPVSLEGIVPDTLSNGILLYNVEEGVEGLGSINSRDVVWMKYTIWRSKGFGPIRDSSYRFGSTDSTRIELEVAQALIATGSYFQLLVNGMNEKGFRTAFVPPSVTNAPDTLRYDLEISGIFERVEFSHSQ